MTLHYNQANVTNFLLDIPDANITKAFRLNVQSALIPGIHIPVTVAPSAAKGLGRAHLPGSTLDFDPLTIRFQVDEDFQSWIDIYTWMLSINNYLDDNNMGWKENVLPKFISLNILDNNKVDIVMTIHFYGAWPSDLNEIEFTYTEDGNPVMTCVATFNFKYYIVERNGVVINHRKSIPEQTQMIEQD